MLDPRPAATWCCALALLFGVPRSAAAQTIFVEPFAGVGSGSSAIAGLSVWGTGTGVVGFRGTGAWLSDSPDGGSGVLGQGGLVFAAPVAGGPPIRPFIGLNVGVAKLRGEDAYPFVRPSIGVIGRPGATWSYVVETGLSVNRDRAPQWSVLGGIMLSTPVRSR